jgi:hypothetical protein
MRTMYRVQVTSHGRPVGVPTLCHSADAAEDTGRARAERFRREGTPCDSWTIVAVEVEDTRTGPRVVAPLLLLVPLHLLSMLPAVAQVMA